jgi:tight adherence protein B
MLLEALSLDIDWLSNGFMVVAVAVAVYIGYRPLQSLVARQEFVWGNVLRNQLLLEVQPRTVTILTAVVMVMLGAVGYAFTESLIGVVLLAGAGAILPTFVVRMLQKRRLDKLENQLVSGIVTLASGVRAGLNLVQSIELCARDGPNPLRQEFAHLIREYEYGVPLEQAMENAATRIGSGDFRLLFAALQTHRERGGDLGETLDRIAESIREIQRLEKRVQTLTAQGRTTARWLGAMPLVVGTIYYLIEPSAVMSLFNESTGNAILLGIVLMNILGFLWIKKIVAIDI